ncbi:hypothetical protein Q8A64_04165 [Oxalobacteraceae bacterium R-40]|uniref:Uncharacterized protein n=1 Tax=Keguizhuia sedimenti TaxID=3064264 RepID=A0ABU1BKU6_9BURK|nr:hypothetical protein [Oxalobacteraceae bacterium R-40]
MPQSGITDLQQDKRSRTSWRAPPIGTRYWPIVLKKSAGTILWLIIEAQSSTVGINFQGINGIDSFNESIVPDFMPFSFSLLPYGA